MAASLQLDADNVSDDVFESPDKEVQPFLEVRDVPSRNTPSPTGYKGYVPPADAFERPTSYAVIAAKTHKTILLGDSGVGKTSLLVQFDTGSFKAGTFSATVGIGFTSKSVTVDEEVVRLQIWDTAGQERFRSITHAYYRDAHALLLLYDVTNKTSFDNIRAWLGEIKDYAQDDVVILLLGNKADCEDRKIRRDQGERLAREYNVMFLETSAKNGLNVNIAFTSIARQLLDKAAGVNTQQDDTIKVSPEKETPFQLQDYINKHSQWIKDSQSACGNCNN